MSCRTAVQDTVHLCFNVSFTLFTCTPAEHLLCTLCINVERMKATYVGRFQSLVLLPRLMHRLRRGWLLACLTPEARSIRLIPKAPSRRVGSRSSPGISSSFFGWCSSSGAWLVVCLGKEGGHASGLVLLLINVRGVCIPYFRIPRTIHNHICCIYFLGPVGLYHFPPITCAQEWE